MKTEGYILIFGFFVIVGLIVWWALWKHSSRRKKLITSVTSNDSASSSNMYLKGFNQKSAMSLGQWVFVAINAESIRVFAEFVTTGTRAYYDLFEFQREKVEQLTVKNLSENKIFVRFLSDITKDGETMRPEFYLRLKAYSKNANLNDAISALNAFKNA